MDEALKSRIENIYSKDKDAQNTAYSEMIDITNQPVDWAYDVWDEMVDGLTHKDNHVRAITAQVLCNLAKSDPKIRMKDIFPALLNVTRDERFVTARHCMQNLWKVGAAGAEQKSMLMDGLVQRFVECASEKNCTLIRYDIMVCMKNLYDVTPDESIRTQALTLIESEDDLKYRKKYAKVWR